MRMALRLCCRDRTGQFGRTGTVLTALSQSRRGWRWPIGRLLAHGSLRLSLPAGAGASTVGAEALEEGAGTSIRATQPPSVRTCPRTRVMRRAAPDLAQLPLASPFPTPCMEQFSRLGAACYRTKYRNWGKTSCPASGQTLRGERKGPSHDRKRTASTRTIFK